MSRIKSIILAGRDTVANLLGLTIAPEAAGMMVKSTDTDEMGYVAEDGSLKFLRIKGTEAVQDVANTDTVNLATDSSGILTATANVSTDNDNVLVGAAGGLKVKDIQIEAGSAPYLGYDTATRTLSVKQLLVSDVTVVPTVANGGQATLVDWVTAGNYTGTEHQKGDVIIVKEANKAYMHKGTTNNDATDFEAIEVPGLSNDAIRALFSGDNVIDYNPATGQFSFKLDGTSDGAAQITSNGLLVDVSKGHIADDHDFLPAIANPAITVELLVNAIGGVAKTALQSHTFSGDTGSATIDQTNPNFGVKGGTLLKTSIIGSDSVVDFDTAGAQEGNFIVLEPDGQGGLKAAWKQNLNIIAAQNALHFNNGNIQWGGDLIEDTVVSGGGNHTVTFETETYIGSGAVATNYTGGNVDAFTPGEVWVEVIGIGTTAVVGDKLVANDNLWSGVMNQGVHYTILAVDGANRVRIDTVNNGGLYTFEPGASFTLLAGSDNNLYVSKDLHINTSTAGTIAKFSPAYMQDNTTGKVGFAPYSLPSSSGSTGQVLTFDANGNLVPTTLNTGISSVIAENGLNSTTANGQVTVKMGGDMETGTTTMEGFLDSSGGTPVKTTDVVWNRLNAFTIDAVDTTIYGRSSFKLNTAQSASRTGGILQSINADGTAEFTPFALPTDLTGASAGSFLKLVDDGNGNLDFDWATESTPLTQGSGITFANNKVHFGGDVTDITTLDLKEFDWTVKSTGTTKGKWKTEIDLEFTTANEGIIMVAPEDGTKWRFGVSSLGNGMATPTVEQIV